MTIEKGQPWGTLGVAPSDLVVADDDEAAARAIVAGRHSVAIKRSDLLRTIGLHGRTVTPHVTEPALILPCDAMRVVLDDKYVITAVSRVQLGTRTRPVAWCSAGGFIGRLNMAPRAHPNDGLVDVLEFARDLPLRTRLAIRRRMRLGDHLPHPQLSMHRASDYEWHDPSRRVAVRVDGKQRGYAHRVRIQVIVDAWVLCVAR
jgi:hypothetical protein